MLFTVLNTVTTMALMHKEDMEKKDILHNGKEVDYILHSGHGGR
jgi:hypothetical protein